jgi:transcriptional/translational regulatory protein YebC/TACO1
VEQSQLFERQKTPSLQDRNLVIEKTIDKALELTTKTKSHVNYVIGEVRGGIHVLLNTLNDNSNFAFSLNS